MLFLEKMIFHKTFISEILELFTITQIADDFMGSINASSDRMLQHLTKFREEKEKGRPIITVREKEK